MLVIEKCFPKMLFNIQVFQCVLDIIFWWTFDFLLNISIRRYQTFKFSLLDFSRHLRKLQLPSCIKEILYVNTHFKGKDNGIKVNRNSFSLVSDVDVEEYMCFFNAELSLGNKFMITFYKPEFKELRTCAPKGVWKLTDLLDLLKYFS